MMRASLEAGKQDLKIGEESDLSTLGSIQKGSLNPFVLINDSENKIRVFVDKKVQEAKTVAFRPMQNDSVTEIAGSDFMKFLEKIGKTATILDYQHIKRGTWLQKYT